MDPIVIVGGGIAGASLAYHLRDAPADVTLLEKSAIGAGTTGKSVGAFARWRAIAGEDERLVDRSWEHYRSLIGDGVLQFRDVGYLRVAETEAGREAIATTAEEFRANGYRAEILAAEDVTSYNLDPAAAPHGALLLPDVGRLDPGQVVETFASGAADAGVTVETGVEVSDVETEAGRVTGVETSEGRFEAGTVVNAAGPWANQVNEMAGESLPIRHVFGPIVVLETETDRALPLTVFENGQYFTGDAPNTYLAGRSPKESTGGGAYDAGTVVDPDGALEVDEAFRMAVARKADAAIPFLADAQVVNSWMCLRCFPPDERPVAGRTSIANFYVLNGFSGVGITYAPAVAELVAERILCGEAHELLEYLSPYRFE